MEGRFFEEMVKSDTATQRARMTDAANEIILESISDGVFTVDHDWRITSFNRAAEEITGTPRREAIGRYCWEVFRSNMCEGDCALKRTMKEGRPFVSSATSVITSRGRQVPITVSTSPLKNGRGEILGGVEVFRDHSLEEELRRELSGTCELGDLVSRSPAMKRLFTILPQVAESDSTVLLEGETGTGKEVIARALHNLSWRRNAPFVAVNCGALPDTLLESELFGYKAGAFTHAVKDKPGLFQAAGSGTIFLDEIGETSAAFQVKLLRVLEERAFRPLGGVKEIVNETRIVAATNRDLAAMVETGALRRDLYYRINVIRLSLPPLRERREDVPLLIEHFIRKLNRLKGRAVQGIGREAMDLLLSHEYPGNIRELENIIEHAFVLCREQQIAVEHLPSSLFPAGERSPFVRRPGMSENVRAVEEEAIVNALKRNNYNRMAAARDLGIHKSTLFRKLRKYRISLPEGDGRSPRG